MDNLKKDDEVVLSIMEHHSNLVPWQYVTKKTNSKLKFMYINKDYELSKEEIESKITDNIEGGENIEETFEATGMAMKPLKSIVNEGNRIRKKAKVSRLQKEVVGSRLRKRAVNKCKELAKKSGRKVVKKTSKKMAKDTSRKVAKENTKIATKAGTAVAGSVAGPEGTLSRNED